MGRGLFSLINRNFEDQIEKRALFALYGIATSFYRTIMSLLNIRFTQNLKAVSLGETSKVSMQIGLLR